MALDLATRTLSSAKSNRLGGSLVACRGGRGGAVSFEEINNCFRPPLLVRTEKRIAYDERFIIIAIYSKSGQKHRLMCEMYCISLFSMKKNMTHILEVDVHISEEVDVHMTKHMSIAVKYNKCSVALD